MKQRAKEIDNQRRAQRAGGSKGYSGISSNMYSNSSMDTKPDITPTPVTYQTSTSTPPIRPSSSGKAMQLGKKDKNVDSFVDRLRSEGQEVVANTAPVAGGAGSATGKTKSQSISLAESQKEE